MSREEYAVRSLREDDNSSPGGSPFESLSAGEREVLDERTFKRMIAVERKRSERSKEPFLLMLLEAGKLHNAELHVAALENLAGALMASNRETDLVGWYKDRTTLGVIFTGLAAIDKDSTLNTIQSRVETILRDELVFDPLDQVSISFHFFPDEWDHGKSGHPINLILYPELSRPGKRRRFLLATKRLIDIVGSLTALLLCLPLLWLIGLAIKFSSKGPVLFSQTRVGQHGKLFVLLKFRTMYVDIDRNVHKEYVTTLINDKADCDQSNGQEQPVYKLTNDKRITRVGRILRRTSLDELPQFMNVLRGEMSLVGPRPAVRYEVAAYQTWHRRRVLEFKPGITGLWQVSGRSRVKFDDMVRMDLRYAMTWSPWLDFVILLRTPLAVIRGTGAY